MKYEDDELAEAALLLSHVDREVPLAKALEDKLFAEGVQIASEARHTTSRLGAMEVNDAPRATRSLPRNLWAPHPAWYAAAAGVALVVHQAQIHRLTAASPVVEVAVPTFPAVLRDARGIEVARVASQDAEHILQVQNLPASQAGDRYQLWISPGPRAQAVPVGFFTCKEACANASFRLPRHPAAPELRSAWITLSRAEERSLAPGAHIVATLGN
jgi:hypothetical protein